jgi:glycosyltransferase involved in cell wall biosynthesis
MPAFKSNDHILEVLSRMPDTVSKVIVVDDACPNGTGKLVQTELKDKRVEVVFNEKNLGVGGAVIVGLRKALETEAEIILKIDSDGQMNPEDIPRLIQPIVNAEADYSKGNRFNSLDDLQEMPKSRVFGNAVLSLMSKLSTGYWSITDPTNGFFAISRGALDKINLGKLRQRWFFESDILFRLSIIRAVVADVPIRAKYANEKSNLKIRKVIFEFINRHNINVLKRLFYVYYLREWSVASFELPAGLILTLGGVIAGVNFWNQASVLGQAATVGQVMLAVLPIILGFQLLLSVLSLDVANEPKRPLYVQKSKRVEK